MDELSITMHERTADENLTDHGAADIRVADHPPPPWWCVIFSLICLLSLPSLVVVLAAGEAMSPEAQHRRARAAAAERKFGGIGELTPDARTILTYAQDDAWMDFAAKTFAAKCAQCHGTRGQGMSGSNLTDDRYVSVRSLEDIYDVIANGRNNNAMPAWKNQLHPNEMVLLSAYVANLRGRNLPGRPPNPRAAPIPPWPPLEPAQEETAPEPR